LKLEIDLNANQHALLMEIASRDRTHRSLASIARGFMIDGLMGEVKKMCSGNRPKTIASLVAASNVQRRKS
jgi:hypothetical protein